MILKNRDKFHYYTSLICVAGCYSGLILSRVLLSVAMIVLAINTIISPNRKEYLKYFFSNTALVSITLIFFVYFISGIYSSDSKYWLERLQIKLPFLILPFAIISLKDISKKDFESLLAIFVILVAGSSCYVLMNYYFNPNEVKYWAGNVMHTPFSHVRFSLLVAFSIFICIHLYLEKVRRFTDIDSYLFLLIGILLVVFLHVLAVRSGLLAFYLSGLVAGFFYMIKNRRWVSGTSFIISFLSVPFLAYLLVPTFRDKMHYVKYNIEQYFNANEIANLSDGQRFYSISQGIEIIENNFLLGVGAGDLKEEVDKVYTSIQVPSQNTFYEVTPMMPHNQWIWIFASTGLIGLLISLVSFFYPLWLLRHNFNILLISFSTIIHTSFFTEATVEEQMGTAFYLIFFLLFIVYYSNNNHE